MADAADPTRSRLAALLQQAETDLGHRFNQPELLTQACTHASRCGAQAAPETKLTEANERLEFLGDALLGAALCLQLYRRFPAADEGTLSRWKAKLASREVLAQALDGTGMLAYCAVGSQFGGRGPTTWPVSVKANFCEALLAAVFLDGGWDPLRRAVECLLAARLEDPAHGVQDPRQQVQEWCLAHLRSLPLYTCVRSGGSDHLPEFTATVTAGPHQASGTAVSRKRAEAAAAETLLERLPR